MQDGRTQIVEVKGHNYYVVDEDRTKGDRRCDGLALSKNFIDEGDRQLSTMCVEVTD